MGNRLSGMENRWMPIEKGRWGLERDSGRMKKGTRAYGGVSLPSFTHTLQSAVTVVSMKKFQRT